MLKTNIILAILLTSVGLTASAQFNILRTEYGVPGQAIGFKTVPCGDWNADNVTDYAVASQYYDLPVSNAGKVEVRSGSDGTLITTFSGSTVNEYFGFSIANGGDINGDGHTDLIVGALGQSTMGAVHVFSGADFSLIHLYTSGPTNDGTGSEVAGAGDMNNDGFDDFIVGSYLSSNFVGDDGRAVVLSGADLGVLHTVYGDSSLERLGNVVSGGFDANGDGTPDFAAAGTFDSYVYSGTDGSVMYSFPNGSTACIRGLKDINGDGKDEFAYFTAISGNGTLFLHSGADGTVLWSKTFDGQATLRNDIQVVPDMDCDTFPDILVGTPGERVGGVNSVGRLRFCSGASGRILHEATGVNLGDFYGSSIGFLGDTDADGTLDFLVSSPFDDSVGLNSGKVSIFSFNFEKIVPSLPFIETFDQLPANTPTSGLNEIGLSPEWTGRRFALPGDIAAGKHWYVSTGQVSAVSGPTNDSTTISGGSGNYLHIDDNGDDAIATIMSPVFDLQLTTSPKLTFKHHTHNQASTPTASENTLSVDVLDVATGTYVLDVYGPVGHEATNNWVHREVDLNGFNGKKVRLRFRANNMNLGNATNTHNIAIDDVAVFDSDTHQLGQGPRPGLSLFDLGNSQAEYFGSFGMTGPFNSTIGHGEILRFFFEGQPNQGLTCFFGPKNPSHSAYGAVGVIDCGLPDANSDGLPEALFLVGDGLAPQIFLDLLFITGPAGTNFIDFPVPQALPVGEIATFQCLFGSSLGVRLSNAITLIVE